MSAGKRPIDAEARTSKVVSASTALFAPNDGQAAVHRTLEVLTAELQRCIVGPLRVLSSEARFVTLAPADDAFRLVLRFMPLTADNLCWWVHSARIAWTLGRQHPASLLRVDDTWYVAAQPMDLLARLGVVSPPSRDNTMQWVMAWRVARQAEPMATLMMNGGVPATMAPWMHNVVEDVIYVAATHRTRVRHVHFEDLWVEGGRARIALGASVAVVDKIDTYARYHRWRSLRGGGDPPAPFISRIYAEEPALQWEGQLLLSLAGAFLGLLVMRTARPPEDDIRMLLAMLPGEAQLLELVADASADMARTDQPLKWSGALVRLRQAVRGNDENVAAWSYPVNDALQKVQLHVSVLPLRAKYLPDFSTFQQALNSIV